MPGMKKLMLAAALMVAISAQAGIEQVHKWNPDLGKFDVVGVHSITGNFNRLILTGADGALLQQIQWYDADAAIPKDDPSEKLVQASIVLMGRILRDAKEVHPDNATKLDQVLRTFGNKLYDVRPTVQNVSNAEQKPSSPTNVNRNIIREPYVIPATTPR